MSSLVDLRIRILRHLCQTSSFKKSWAVWEPLIRGQLGTHPSGKSIFQLGEHLSEVFVSNSKAGRDQSDLSGGGTAWECLIVWYLNLVFWNTNVIATRSKLEFVPQVIRDGLSVTIGGYRTNTESDVLVYSVPDPDKFVVTAGKKNVSAKTFVSILDAHLGSRLNQVSLSNVQCKTNWNDNAQIPMLWDMLYNSVGSKIKAVMIGHNGIHPASFGNFAYSFVTVPTNKKGRFGTDALAVLRIRNLTGGNFWGKPSKAGVASCVNEFFGRLYASSFSGGVIAHIDRQVADDPQYLDKFLSLDWKAADAQLDMSLATT